MYISSISSTIHPFFFLIEFFYPYVNLQSLQLQDINDKITVANIAGCSQFNIF